MSRKISVSTSFAGLGVLALVLVVLLGAVMFGARPPAVVAASAGPDVFSAERAMRDVRGLVGDAPTHAIGTADHARARDYVMKRLQELGLTPTIERSRLCHASGECVVVENVVARIEGASPPAILLAAHYDSVPTGPGAGDDAAGTAVVLETVRALRSGPPISHPVIVLIDDGEEAGLLGAREFVRLSPSAKEARVVLNFEARGNFGQTAMFETSAGNAWLIDAYASVSRPTASSLIYTLYQKLPNDTDLTVFKKAGMLGLNFAFADGVWDYHTPSDSPERLDPRSVQHMGDQALAVLRALQAVDLGRPATGDAVYFDLFSVALVRYPASFALPLALFASLVLAFALFRGARLGIFDFRGILRGFLAALLAPIAALAAGAVVFWILCARHGVSRLPLAGPMPAWLALISVAVAASSALGLSLVPPADPRAALAGGSVFLAMLAVMVAGALPGASYLFLFPLLASGIAIVSTARSPSPSSPRARLVAFSAVALVAGVVFFPLFRILLVMVGVQMHPATTVPIALVFPMFFPLLADVRGQRRWLVPGAALLVACVFIAVS